MRKKRRTLLSLFDLFTNPYCQDERFFKVTELKRKKIFRIFLFIKQYPFASLTTNLRRILSQLQENMVSLSWDQKSFNDNLSSLILNWLNPEWRAA